MVMTFFKLCDGSEPGGARDRGLSCDRDGLRLGGYALVDASTGLHGRRVYRPRSLAAINAALSIGYGSEVDFASRMPGLRQAALYLSEGKWALAQIAALHLRMPDLPDAAAAARLRKAEMLLRYNPNHRSAGPGGGQFTAAGGVEAPGAPAAAASDADKKNPDGSSPQRAYPTPSGTGPVRHYSKEEAANLPPPPAGTKYVTLADGSVVWAKYANHEAGGPLLFPADKSIADDAQHGSNLKAEYDGGIRGHESDQMFDWYYNNNPKDYQRAYGQNGLINRDFVDSTNYGYGVVAAAAGYSLEGALVDAGLVNSTSHILTRPDGPNGNKRRNADMIIAGYNDCKAGKIPLPQK
jgi:hypothetical protein